MSTREITLTARHVAIFDFDKTICDQHSELAHMMPSEALFQQAVQGLGIKQHSAIVVFDRLGIFSSPRVWWMFKSMGFNNIAVLDGGLIEWKKSGLPVVCGKEKQNINKGDFIASYQAELIFDAKQVLQAINDSHYQIIDARSEPRFLANVAEPRVGLRSGHMPSAKNLPFSSLLKDGKMADVEQLTTLFSGVAGKQSQLVFSCGSGVTACLLALGATLCGYEKLSVYDGSWSEWGANHSLPVVS